MVVRSHGARVRAVKEGDIKVLFLSLLRWRLMLQRLTLRLLLLLLLIIRVTATVFLAKVHAALLLTRPLMQKWQSMLSL